MCLVLALGFAASGQDAPRIAFAERDGVAVIVAEGLPESIWSRFADGNLDQARWEAAFPIKTCEPSGRPTADQPNVAGHYEAAGGELVFTPQFPFSARVVYHAAVVAEGVEMAHAVLRFENGTRPPAARVAAVYPSADTLPANLLKFYIYFSAPMSRGVGYDYIRLLRSDGTPVMDPFPEIGVELWDNRQQRFTLLLDPGRIKRGIRINEEMGLPLVPGQSYRLEIASAWPDAHGKPLAEGHVKHFTVTEPDHEFPDADTWEITPPPAGSRDPFTVAFPDPLEAALLERLVWLEGPDGKEVPGQTMLEEDETRWAFVPEKAWPTGSYTLRVDGRLEDLAGNQVRRPFELDLEAGPRLKAAEDLRIPVEVR